MLTHGSNILKNDELKMGLESKLEDFEIYCSNCKKLYEFVDFATDNKPECDRGNSFVIELYRIGLDNRSCECESTIFDLKGYTSLSMYSIEKKEDGEKNV